MPATGGQELPGSFCSSSAAAATHSSQTEPADTLSLAPTRFFAGTAEFLFEPYIETDSIAIRHNELHYCPKEGWLELTVGVLEHQGNYHALNPSITIAEGAVLSLEEKFQGGQGS